MKQWITQIMVALDQLLCTLCGGWADETISSYAYRLDRKGRLSGRVLRPAIDFVALRVFRQDRHCLKSYESERVRAQCPPELRL